MKRSFPDLSFLLFPLVPFYWIFYLLDRGLKLLARKKHPSAKVISVGNLTAGGTGKTPMVILLALKLKARRPVVLTRGYASGTREALITGKNTNTALHGDEPVLIARETGCTVSLNRDRYKGMLRAGGKGLFIMDDGFQHYRMARDLMGP